jgi:glycerol-3-phosphate acyltransferase PlsY
VLPALLIALAVGYLLGALPFGYLVARAKGVNIFEVGSKNPGATNVRRVLGHGPGNIVLALDLLKGALAAGWPGLSITTTALPGAGTQIQLAFGFDTSPALEMGIAGLVGTILGHSFSCFTGFRGGKSVATGAGGFAVLFPFGMLIGFVVWLGTLGLSRYVSLASMLGAISLPITAVLRHEPPVLTIAASLISLFVIHRHRANIARLVAGTESKVGRKPAASVPPDPSKP